jgi:excisionase family DNA binding protein
MARLVFLSRLRDPNSGTYRYPPTNEMADEAEIDSLSRKLHEEAFTEWLNFRLEEQRADLDLFFSGWEGGKLAALGTWLNLESYRLLVPASAEPHERQLFFCEMRMLLCLMTWEGQARSSGPQRGESDEFLLTIEDLSRLLGISSRSLRRSAKHGVMPSVKVGRRWLFRAGAVSEWLRARQIGSETSFPEPRRDPDAQRDASQPICGVTCCGTDVPWLSAREEGVMQLIAQGKGTKEIAALLSITEATVGQHRKQICRKIGLHSTGELVACAVGRLNGICRRTGPAGRTEPFHGQ